MSRAGSYQQQYAAQYWQYQQNMQAYAYAAQQQGFAPAGVRDGTGATIAATDATPSTAAGGHRWNRRMHPPQG